jgi:hydrogenase nickel incorporation protein HypA/HybF
MHELSIAQDILEIVKQNVPEDELSKVRTIKLKIGEFAGIVVDSLEFCFEAVIAETSLNKAKLEIDNVKVEATCKSCGRNFKVQNSVFKCPYCIGVDIEITSGAELKVVEFELED